MKSLFLKKTVSQIIGGTQIDNRIKKHHILEKKFENTRNLKFFTKINYLLQRSQRFCPVTVPSQSRHHPVTVPSLGVLNRPTSLSVLNRPLALNVLRTLTDGLGRLKTV